MRGQIIRAIGFDPDGEPMMVLRPKVSHGDRCYRGDVIKLQDAWRFSSEHNPNHWMLIRNYVVRLFELFGLGQPEKRQFVETAILIEDGIDQLLKTPPAKVHDTTQYGEATATINGERSTVPMVDEIHGGHIGEEFAA